MYPKSGDLIRMEKTLRVWGCDGIDYNDLNSDAILPVSSFFLIPGDTCLVVNASVKDHLITEKFLEMVLFVDGGKWVANISSVWATDPKEYFKIVASTDAQRHHLGGEF